VLYCAVIRNHKKMWLLSFVLMLTKGFFFINLFFSFLRPSISAFDAVGLDSVNLRKWDSQGIEEKLVLLKLFRIIQFW